MGREASARKERKCKECGEPLRYADATDLLDHANICMRMRALNLVSGRSSYSIVRVDDGED